MHELYQADAFVIVLCLRSGIGLDIAGLSGVFIGAPGHMCRWSLTESSVRWLRLRRERMIPGVRAVTIPYTVLLQEQGTGGGRIWDPKNWESARC